jgi:hypothetical protein
MDIVQRLRLLEYPIQHAFERHGVCHKTPLSRGAQRRGDPLALDLLRASSLMVALGMLFPVICRIHQS